MTLDVPPNALVWSTTLLNSTQIPQWSAWGNSKGHLAWWSWSLNKLLCLSCLIQNMVTKPLYLYSEFFPLDSSTYVVSIREEKGLRAAASEPRCNYGLDREYWTIGFKRPHT